MDDFFYRIGMSVMGVAGLIIAFFTKRVVMDVDNLKKSDADCKLDLAEFKTRVATDYADKRSTQASLARIHDKMEDGFGTLHQDIKSILTAMNTKGQNHG